MKREKARIQYQDDDLIIVEKPAATLTIPDRIDALKFNIREWLMSQFDPLFVVHRLDKDTSGIIIFAKNERAHKILNEQFANHEVQKTYWAFVNGVPFAEEGMIDQAILSSLRGKRKSKVHHTGKASQTGFKVLENYKQYSLVECYPKSGRLHQIRVHLEYIGNPLIIDPMYGGQEKFYLSSIKRKKFRLAKDQQEKPLVSRQTLHARSISFIHPTTEKRVEFSMELPKDMGALRKQLNKWSLRSRVF